MQFVSDSIELGFLDLGSKLAIIGDALLQAFMPKCEYKSFREEDRAWEKLQRPLLMAFVALVCLVIVVCTVISLNIVFLTDPAKRPFCGDRRLNSLMNVRGIIVAYSAPTRHGCLKVIENNYCASKRGGVRCLSILNDVFAVIFGLLALFLGSSLLTLGSSCFVPLFWCYEVGYLKIVILYGGTAFFLRRRATSILDEGDFGGRNLGLEMLENPIEVSPEVERRVNEGFKAWMGSSLLLSDEEDELGSD